MTRHDLNVDVNRIKRDDTCPYVIIKKIKSDFKPGSIKLSPLESPAEKPVLTQSRILIRFYFESNSKLKILRF